MLLNLWATWCLPCRKEMPALDRLQKELGSDKFEVVAVSVDRKGLDGAKKFLDETKVEQLALYADADRAHELGAEGGRPAGDAAARRARAARSAACSAPPNGTARTPSA